MVIDIKNIKNIAFSALFTALMVAFSLMYIPLTVPITLQTFAVFLSLLVLGSKWGFVSVATYMLLGFVGLPVFSGFRSGPSALLSPTGGYLIGLLLICLTYALLDKLFKGKYKRISLFLGLLICYLAGSFWYMLFSGEGSLWAVFSVCVAPFIIPDIVKLIFAFIIAKRIGK